MEGSGKQNELFSNTIDETGKAYILETARWARFVAIVMIILQSLMLVLAVIFSYANGADVSRLMGQQAGLAAGVAVFIFYVFILLIFFYPLICLLKFSGKIRTALATGDTELISEAFRNLKNMFKFFGIFLIVILAVYGIVMLIGLLSLAFLY